MSSISTHNQAARLRAANPCSSILPHLAPFIQSTLFLSYMAASLRALAILTNIGFGASIVVLNAYLPRLAVSSLPFSNHGDTGKLSRATACISSLGIAFGYTVLLASCSYWSPYSLCSAQEGSINTLRFAIGASARPRSTSTPTSIGSAAQSISTRNRNAYRILPVKSATIPTTRGPIKDEDCRELPINRWFTLPYGRTHSLSVMETGPYRLPVSDPSRSSVTSTFCASSNALASGKSRRVGIENNVHHTPDPCAWSSYENKEHEVEVDTIVNQSQ